MQNNELLHYGVKGQKWGVINKKDDPETRLSYEKNRLKYDYLNREAESFYKNQNQKDKQDYKKDIKLAKIERQISKGKDITNKAISRDERLGKKYKAKAQIIASVAAALSLASIGRSFATAAGSGGIGNVYNKVDSRHDYTENKQRVNIGNTTTQVDSKGLVSIARAKKKYVTHSEDIDNILENNNVLISDLNSLSHFGILGQKWGIRRFQNKDGSLTPEGRLKYYGSTEKQTKAIEQEVRTALANLENKDDFKALSDAKKDELRRAAAESAIQSANNKMMENARLQIMKDADAYAIAKVNTGKKVLEDTSSIFYKSASIVPNVQGKNSYPDYSDISTEELRKRTERLTAEKNYAIASDQLVHVPSKQEITREKLQTIGSVAGILATVGGIALTLEQLKRYGTSGGKS